MCLDMGVDNSAQREALRMQRMEALRAARAEQEARVRDKAEMVEEREQEAEGRQIASLALFGARPGLTPGMRSIFMATG